jgi:hypothetical protein
MTVMQGGVGPVGNGPSEEAKAEFGVLQPRVQLEAASDALRRHGMDSVIVDAGDAAKNAVMSMLPIGAEVFNNTSRTLEHVGLAEEIERSGSFRSLRLQLYQMDHEMQRREMRQLAAAPDFVVGSAHAVTTEGSLLVASASGSQLGPLVSGAGQVVLVVGGQKVVADVAAGMRRIHEYCFPLEDARAREAYGVPSGVNNILIINQVVVPDRITVVLVDEVIGF